MLRRRKFAPVSACFPPTSRSGSDRLRRPTSRASSKLAGRCEKPMLEREEIVRRIRRFLELAPGLRKDALRALLSHEMRPERLRRLSRVLELLEQDIVPDVDTLPRGRNRYRRVVLRAPAPPCKPLMVLDLSGATPRMVTTFVNPNTMPELAF